MMKRNFLLLLLLVSVSGVFAQPVKQHGKLKVVGTQLTDEGGKPVVLRGMSFGWHNWWPRFYNKEVVTWLATDWKCNVVRAAMGIEPDKGYLKDPAGSREKIEAVIDGAIEAGIYVIIDWHSHGVQTEKAKQFFTEMAAKYGSYPNVIYEVFNEPDDETWPEVKTYSEAVIAAIRAVDPDNVILVGSPHWDQDVHLVADDPLQNQTNIMYTLHFYAATHKDYLRKRGDYALSKGIPLFISESAGMEASGDGALNEAEWQRWIDWAEHHKISWITWSVADKEETCSVLQKSASSTGGWKEADLKESGKKARAFIRQYNSNQQNMTAHFKTFKKTGVAFVILAMISCASTNYGRTTADTLVPKDLSPVGRTAITSNQLELISSASHFSFRFNGRSCRLFVSLSDWQDHNYLQYELDGVYQKRIRIDKNLKEPVVLSANAEGNHTITVYKATEAHTGPVFIQKIEAKEVRPLAPPAKPIIEFIGNSITCGAAADASDVPCGTGDYHDQHNAYHAYGSRVARTLQTAFLLSSVSGIGIYRNWNSDGPTMPKVYKQTDFQEASNRPWDFKTYAPVIVSIALGTNDFSNGDGKKQRLPFDSVSYVSNYIGFVQQVKAAYPKAQVALLSSPMLNGERRQLLQNCLAAVKLRIDRLFPGDKPVALHFFKPMQARGCTGHPSVDDHRILAEELVPFFKKLLP